jgi:hypothetical protein
VWGWAVGRRHEYAVLCTSMVTLLHRGVGVELGVVLLHFGGVRGSQVRSDGPLCKSSNILYIVREWW